MTGVCCLPHLNDGHKSIRSYQLWPDCMLHTHARQPVQAFYQLQLQGSMPSDKGVDMIFGSRQSLPSVLQRSSAALTWRTFPYKDSCSRSSCRPRHARSVNRRKLRQHSCIVIAAYRRNFQRAPEDSNAGYYRQPPEQLSARPAVQQRPRTQRQLPAPPVRQVLFPYLCSPGKKAEPFPS